MEKEIPDSMTTVQIKPEYAASESAFGSEPPPQAYHRQQSTAVQITKIIAVTVFLVTLLLGGFILASAYITSHASCNQMEQELALLKDTLNRYQSILGPMEPEELVQEEIKIKTHKSPAIAAESKTVKVHQKEDNNVSDDSAPSSEYDSDDSDDDSSSEEQDRIPIHIKLPLQLDFDDLAGALIEKNQRSRMNCIVEKKRAEEVVDHQPKNINLPFGVNITTDPRYEHVSGERMAIFCESGNMLRNGDPPQRDTSDTIMIQPIMIPIPPSNYPTHMNMQQQQGPPMMNMMQQQQPMHPMEQMRPPMPHSMVMMPPPQQQQQSPADQQQQPSQQQNHLPPSAVLHHIAQQIIMQQLEAKHRAAAAQAAAEEAQTNELGTNEVKMSPLQRLQEMQRMSRIPIPAAILNELQRIPSNARGEVIVAVSQDPSSEESGEPQQMSAQQPSQQPMMPPQPADIMRVIQHARESAQGMNGRQTYARGLPVDIPVPMMQQEAEDRAAAASEQHEETRPHYVHPRSVRSVDSVLLKGQKRVKRCACDCAC